MNGDFDTLMFAGAVYFIVFLFGGIAGVWAVRGIIKTLAKRRYNE